MKHIINPCTTKVTAHSSSQSLQTCRLLHSHPPTEVTRTIQLSAGGQEDKRETEAIIYTTRTAKMFHGEHSYGFEVLSVATSLESVCGFIVTVLGI